MMRTRFLSITLALAVCVLGSACGKSGGSNAGLMALLFTGGDSTTNSMTGFSINGVAGTIDQINGTITVNLPCNTLSVTDLAAEFIHNGTSVTVDSIEQETGVTENDFSGSVTYTVTAENGDAKEYDVTVSVAPGDSKAITSFSIDGNPGLIDEENHTITVALPCTYDSVDDLVADFSITGTEVRVGPTLQESGVTSNDFGTSVIYTVEACNTTEQTYTVTVERGTSKAITAFSINGYAGSINQADHTIAVSLPCSTPDVTELIATFTASGSREVRVGTTVQESEVTQNDFTGTVTYTVEACDSMEQTYTVTVTLDYGNDKDFTAYSIDGNQGFIVGKNIHVIMPAGSSTLGQIANFTTTGQEVRVSSTVQESGTTPNDFTGPVTYTVEACNGTTKQYIVEVYLFSEIAIEYDDNPTPNSVTSRIKSAFKTESDYFNYLTISQTKPLMPMYEMQTIVMMTYPDIQITSLNAGSDGLWFTPDDTYYLDVHQFVDTTHRRNVEVNSSGTITGYAAFTYDGTGRIISYRYYEDDGPDSTWFTADDVEQSFDASRYTATWNTATSVTGISYEDDGTTIVNRYSAVRDTTAQTDIYTMYQPNGTTIIQRLTIDYSHTLIGEFHSISGMGSIMVKKSLTMSNYESWHKGYEATASPSDDDWWDGDEVFGIGYMSTFMQPYTVYTYDGDGYRDTATHYSDDGGTVQEAHTDYSTE